MKRLLGAVAVIIFLLYLVPGSALAREWAPLASSENHQPRLPQNTDYKLFLPFITNATCNGLFGLVSDHGVRVQGVSLNLRFYNGATWSTLMTRATAGNGLFCFSGLGSLAPGQAYYVRYGPQGTDDTRLSSWSTRLVESYAAGAKVYLGDFDLADIPLVSPGPGASVTLPKSFTWTRRTATPSDSYELNIFDPANTSVYDYTDPLGYVSGVTINRLPQGFTTNKTYGWYVAVWGPDDGYGTSFYYNALTFLNTGLSVGSMRQSGEHSPQDRFQAPMKGQ